MRRSPRINVHCSSLAIGPEHSNAIKAHAVSLVNGTNIHISITLLPGVHINPGKGEVDTGKVSCQIPILTPGKGEVNTGKVSCQIPILTLGREG